MRYFLFVLLTLVGTSSVVAQVTIEEEVQTDSIDVFATRETGKSSGLAMAASILLPGLGHQYLGQHKKAYGFFAVETSLWFSYVFAGRFSNRLIDDAKTLAWREADVAGGPGADEFFWQNVGIYMDDGEYNRIQELNREEDLLERKYLSENLTWQWSSDSLREEYVDIRHRATQYRVASSFILAALVIDRVVAFIDTRVATKYRGIRGTGTARAFRVVPYFQGSASGLELHQEF